MLITLSIDTTTEQIDSLFNSLLEKQLKPQLYRIDGQSVIAVENNCNNTQILALEAMNFVEKVVPITKPYKLVSREYKSNNTIIKVKNLQIGSGNIHIIAGPCAVESREQIIETAYAVKEAGATILRGGAFKPRTSPYSFQGLGEEGLAYLAEAGRLTGLPVITEVMDINDIDLVYKYADILQIVPQYAKLFIIKRISNY